MVPVGSPEFVAPVIKTDVVNPSHYSRLNPQPIDVSLAWYGPAYLRGTAIKYLARAGFKEGVDAIDDLRKAMDYIRREIDYIKSQREAPTVAEHSSIRP